MKKNGNKSHAKPAFSSVSMSQDLIAERAYRKFEARGREGGHELEDWLSAESELRHELEKAKPRRRSD